MELISASIPQYKANLHSHSTLSDGALEPDALIRAYREQGYSVLSITDHEAPYDHTAASTDDFLLVTGYEAYIHPSSECIMDPYGPEIHLNLLAKDPHNTGIVGYDPQFCKYMPHELAASRVHYGALGPRRYEHEYIQAFIATAKEAGYLVTYNHPCWSMEDPADILSYDGYFSLEIFNTGSKRINGYENNMALYDRILRSGKFPFVHGADDNHNKKPFGDPLCDSFGSWTMIQAPALRYDAIMGALESGAFYASTGPTIYSLHVEGKHVELRCSPAARVMMHMTPKRSQNAYRSDGAPVDCAVFDIPDYAPYVYFSVFDSTGGEAHTHAYIREQLRL